MQTKIMNKDIVYYYIKVWIVSGPPTKFLVKYNLAHRYISFSGLLHSNDVNHHEHLAMGLEYFQDDDGRDFQLYDMEELEQYLTGILLRQYVAKDECEITKLSINGAIDLDCGAILDKYIDKIQNDEENEDDEDEEPF